MPLWGWQGRLLTSPHQQAAWCTVLLDTTECCTWTSSKMVACSWLVSVVRCFWSSNLVLDEFIPVGKRKGQRIYGEVQSWSYHLPNAFLHTLTLPLQGASTWRQLHKSTQLSQFIFRKTKDTEFIKRLQTTLFVLCRRYMQLQITFSVLKYCRPSKHFLQKRQTLLTTWEHEKPVELSWKFSIFLPWIVLMFPPYSNSHGWQCSSIMCFTS